MTTRKTTMMTTAVMRPSVCVICTIILLFPTTILHLRIVIFPIMSDCSMSLQCYNPITKTLDNESQIQRIEYTKLQTSFFWVQINIRSKDGGSGGGVGTFDSHQLDPHPTICQEIFPLVVSPCPFTYRKKLAFPCVPFTESESQVSSIFTCSQ